MSGFELLSVVRRRFPEIAVIAMSGTFTGDGMQPGVAADRFYEKATGLSSLFAHVEALTKPELLVSVAAKRAATPLWIARKDHAAPGEPYLTISCPDCLRTFVEVPGKGDGTVHNTGCVHCGTAIRYAIVQSTEPALPASYETMHVLHA